MKAYKNNDFLDSPDARLLRILSEFVEPKARFAKNGIEDTIVFMGSARAPSPEEASSPSALGSAYEACRDLASRFTQWSKTLPEGHRRFVVCSGGGPGIMEAANRGASEAGGINIGLGISLPHEQENNRFVTRELSLEFHYFFMRKFWFVYLAKAVVLFPGGFGTMDEMFELLTLVQTRKTQKKLPIVLYGEHFWDDALNLDALQRWGTISEGDLDLFHISSTPQDAFEYLRDELVRINLDPGEDPAH